MHKVIYTKTQDKLADALLSMFKANIGDNIITLVEVQQNIHHSFTAFTCSKSTIETLEKHPNPCRHSFVQSQQWNHPNNCF